MEPRCPFSRLNIETKDFFSIPKGDFDAVIGNPPYTRWTEIPEETKELIMERVGDLIKRKRYDLVANIRRGKEPQIYVYWILHATKNLLKNNGRLGMIISNMWLQTDYGIKFGKFLLDNFKIKALIDISYRLFEALISTVILLAEKESNEIARNNNEVLLIRIPPIDSKLGDKEVETKIDEALKCIESAITPNYEFDKNTLEVCKQSYGIWYGFVKQFEIPRDKKWISLFFERAEDIVKTLEKHPLMIKAGEWFKPSRGNSVWSIWALDHHRRPDLGAKKFFYFSNDKIADWDAKVKGFREAIMMYLVPAITASRNVRTFTFTEKDWEEIRDRRSKKEGKYSDAWILVLHEHRERLPKPLQEYIRWGETECKTEIRGTRGGGRICSEAEACRAREEREARRWFYGWYDLGGYVPTPIMAIRQAGYHPQFFLVKMPLVTYDAIITFIPRVRVRVGNWVFDPGKYRDIIGKVNDNVELDEVEVKALLAYLNSTFNWLWLEQSGRRTGGGILALEVNIAERMPILNVKAIDRGKVEELAELFDELEAKARELMEHKLVSDDPPDDEEGEDRRRKLRMFRQLRSVFSKIDREIADILGLDDGYLDVYVNVLPNQAEEMMKRRVSGAGRKVTPGVEGIELNKPNKRSRKGGRKRGSQDKVVPLTKWLEQGDEYDRNKSP
jgi:hypothetical protein